MTKEHSSSTNALDENKLNELRDILLGEECSLITDKVKAQSRKIVKEVIAEALYDRQKQGDDIDNILHPIVERSVETSFSSHSDKLINSLYPLVGGLVRKSVQSFFNDFIEKTNQLLENSLTIKGITWRIKARQAGVSFAQYVASQTFLYRVEHILLIHRETGILLHSIDHNKFSDSNVDLISSMLTAINDFVADSLALRDENEEQLQTIRTDNFSLLIKPGPHAMIVVAVTGNPPHRLLDKMQLTLENIHHFYDHQLRDFTGNIDSFNDVKVQLQGCLLSEEKLPEKSKKNKPWFFYLFVFMLFIGIGYLSINSWHRNQLIEKINQLDEQPGYVIQSLEVDFDKTIYLNVIRDPVTLSIKDWFNKHNIDTHKLLVNEHFFYSIDPTVNNKRIERIFRDYPSLAYTWQNAQLVIRGTLPIEDKKRLLERLSTVSLLFSNKIDLSQLEYIFPDNTLDLSNKENKQQLFFLLLAEFNQYQLNFELDISQLNEKMLTELDVIADKYKQLSMLAEQLDYRLALVLIGTSGTTGDDVMNKILSLKRSENVKKSLISLGVDADTLHATNIGTMYFNNLSPHNVIKTRKVLFNVVHVDVNQPEHEL